MAEGTTKKGLVVEWNDLNGEGWIEGEDGEKVFAHITYVARKELQPSFFKRLFTTIDQNLVKGELVEYEVFDWKGNKKKIEKFGLRAINIRPVERIEELKKKREEAKAKKDENKKSEEPETSEKQTENAQPHAA